MNTEIDAKLLNLSNKEEWFDLITDKSIVQSQAYLDNKVALNEYESFITKRGEGGHFTRDEADELLSAMLDLYYDDCDDYEIIFKAINPLIEFYKREHNFSALVKLHSIRNYELVEFWSRQSDEASLELVLSDALKAISYKAYYHDLDDEAKRKIFSNYYNIVNVNLKEEGGNYVLSHYYLTEVLNFWNSPMLTDEDRAQGDLAQIVQRTKEDWLSTFEKLENSPPAIQEYYIKISDEIYNKYISAEDSEEKISYEIVVSHYKSLLLKGQITPEEGLEKIVNFYLARRDYLSSLSMESADRMIDMSFEYVDYLYFFINVPVSVLTWIEVHNIPAEEYSQYMSIFLNDLHEKWDELYTNLPAPYLDNYIMDICLTLIPYSVTEEEQEIWLKKLLLKRNLPTFIHTNMVAALSAAITKRIIECAPEILACEEWPLDRIRNNKEELLKYMNDASLFHDLGKARIGDIISTQTRPISREEFGLIMNHPSFGAKFVEKAPFLEKYHDIILGHHKFYDGKGGYPKTYDNTKSKMQPIVDLITICDCLDAATDYLSRNYNNAKNIDEVYSEICAAKGTRYNPELSDYLMKDTELKEELGYITGEGRIQKYYDIYEQYLAH